MRSNLAWVRWEETQEGRKAAIVAEMKRDAHRAREDDRNMMVGLLGWALVIAHVIGYVLMVWGLAY